MSPRVVSSFHIIILTKYYLRQHNEDFNVTYMKWADISEIWSEWFALIKNKSCTVHDEILNEMFIVTFNKITRNNTMCCVSINIIRFWICIKCEF